MKSQQLRQFIRKTIKEYAGHFTSKNATPRPVNDKAEMKQYFNKNNYSGGLGNHYNKDTVGYHNASQPNIHEGEDTKNTAGILIQYKNEYMLCQRESGKWSIPKGHLKEGEEVLDGALRELKEETQITLLPDYDLYTLRNKTLNKEGGDYSIYQIKVSDKLTPKLNHEHKDYEYFTQDNLPEPLDKGLSFLNPLKEDKKKPCKPSKGKRFAKRVDGKCRSYGQKGKAKKGGDRIRPGTKKGDAYCARSAKIKKCKNPPCANALSRKKWKCKGSKSVAQ